MVSQQSGSVNTALSFARTDAKDANYRLQGQMHI